MKKNTTEKTVTSKADRPLHQGFTPGLQSRPCPCRLPQPVPPFLRIYRDRWWRKTTWTMVSQTFILLPKITVEGIAEFLIFLQRQNRIEHLLYLKIFPCLKNTRLVLFRHRYRTCRITNNSKPFNSITINSNKGLL